MKNAATIFAALALCVSLAAFGLSYKTYTTGTDVIHKEQRAYMAIDKDAMKLNADGTRDGYIIVKNFGLSPAFDVHTQTGTALGAYPIQEKEFDAAPHEYHVQDFPTVAPNIAMQILFKTQSMGPKQTEAFQAGKAAIYIFGKISYRDIFGKTHINEFRTYETAQTQGQSLQLDFERETEEK